MSESSTTLGTLFDAPRTIIDQTFETQQTINRQGLDLTRSAVKPFVGATVGGDDAESQVDDAFERLDETQADVLDEVQHVVEQPVDGSERVAQWSVDLLENQVGRLQAAAETEKEMAEDVGESAREMADSAEDTTEDAVEAAEDTVRETADAAQDTVQRTTDAAEETVDSVADVADDVVDDLQADLEAAAEEFDALEDVDETAAEGLAADGIESVSDLASAQVSAVADAGYTTQDQAQEWIEAAVEYEGVALADLDGIGETYADRLNAAGIRTVDQLARTSADDVADVAEVDEDRAADWIKQAQDAA